jgi:cystathionine beta-lyase/cystathionine gamma-synthase
MDPAVRACDSLELAWVGTSLGGHKTLVGHAASTTHRQMDAEARRAAGIADGLVRVSVGLEDADDVIEDFAQALEKA